MHKLSLGRGLSFAFASVAVLACQSWAKAELRPDKVHVADSKKNQSYIRDGLITGGDKSVDEVVVKDIRRAANAGYERIVIDLEGSRNGEATAIPRPPYYQVSVTPDEKRIVFTIWGKPRLNFDSKKVLGAFKRSSVIQGVELLPRVEDATWSFVFALKGDTPVEVFELSNPVRVIMDVKGGAPTKVAAEPKHAAPKAPKGKKPQKSHKPAKAPVHEELPLDMEGPAEGESNG